MYDSNISRLEIILKAMAYGDFSISTEQTSEKAFEDFNSHLRTTLKHSIEAKGHSLSFEEIARSALTLLEEKRAEWLLSPEGQTAQKSALATEIYIGAKNTDFPLEEAKKLANKEFQPFSAVIKILRQNGYTVQKDGQ